MKKRKICLFTAHSPTIGGGGANFRSLINYLPDLTFDWYYLAFKAVDEYETGWLGKGFMGDRLDIDIRLTWQMLAGNKISSIDAIVEKLYNVDCDSYWIVSHNEGLRIAVELSKLEKKRPIHLTINDDWAGAICARSIRYRFMSGLANRMTIDVLNRVNTFDVTSYGMQSYYKDLSGRVGDICHRYIPAEDVDRFYGFYYKNPDKLRVGHIGSIYSKSDFFQFVDMVKTFALDNGLVPEINMWGWKINKQDVPIGLRSYINGYDGLPEHQVVSQLAQCDIVYAMYPMNVRMRLFSKTSMPTKLSSYIQATRPIFGHGPSDSSLAEFLMSTNTGMLWNNMNKNDGLNILSKIIEMKVDLFSWQSARERYYGENNLITLRRVFLENTL